jgi:gluconolactonase
MNWRRWIRETVRRLQIAVFGPLLPVSPHFAGLFSPGVRLERLATGFRFTEGPVWIPGQACLLFSDIPANCIHRMTADGRVSVFREPSGQSNGLTRDAAGRLIACEQRNRRVTRTETDGTLSVLADSYNGQRLNSPNDVVVGPDGAIYFTDPPYGIRPEQQQVPHQGVYRLDPEHGDISLVADDFDRPNGLAFSPDGKRLYIDDSSERRHIRVFDVGEDGSLSNGRLFHDMRVPQRGAPDGMKVDAAGNVYCTGARGVWVFDPDGRHLGTIRMPEKPSNCAWGDRDCKSLYITAPAAVYRIRVSIPGSGVALQAV